MSDLHLVPDLDRRIRELDELAARDRTLEHMAQESAKRRFLLLELEAAGVFDPEFRLPEDAPSDLSALHSVATAGRQVSNYLRSAVRRNYNAAARPQPVVGSPVSIDWFRFPSPHPAHLSADEWLAYCENILTYIERTGGGGEIFARAGENWWTLTWRKDDGIHPALVSARR